MPSRERSTGLGEVSLDVGQILQVPDCQVGLRLLRHSPEEVALDVGEILQVGECQAGFRLLRPGLRRVVVRPVAGRGGGALAGGQRQGGGREPGQRDGETVDAVGGVMTTSGDAGDGGSAARLCGRSACVCAGPAG